MSANCARYRFSGPGKQGWSTPDRPTVPIRQPSFLSNRTTGALRATWLGHACYYVEFPSGLRVLFDPVFTDRCSPFTWLGPKRFTAMPCRIKDIPIIDAVVISHSHYDHLSLPTVREIHALHPRAHFFVPLGNKQWFNNDGIHTVTELDWWQTTELTLSDQQATSNNPDISATISCLPAQHTSGRTPFDRARTLWASWSVKSGDKNLYFAGDTGYRAVPRLADSQDDYALPYPHCPAFSQIGKLRGPFDLGLIPIGAYSPRFFMSPMHANPYDSVNIFADTQCKRALGMHWGTWVLTNEDVMEPPRLLKKAMAGKRLPETGVFDVCDIGESREF